MRLIVRWFWHCCRLPFLGSVMTKDWVQLVGHSPVCQILLQIVVRAVITFSLPIWTSSAGMLSTPADFPFFNDCTAASTSLRRMGWSYSVSVWVQFSTDGSPLALWLYNSEQYSDVNRWTEYCSEYFTSTQENECDKGTHQLYLGTEINTSVISNWF